MLKKIWCFIARCNSFNKLTEEEKFLSRASSLEDLERLQKIWNNTHDK
jgi:hypothetical protein